MSGQATDPGARALPAGVPPRHRFVVRVDRPPVDRQLQRLFAAVGDAAVEVGAWRGWAAVVVERAAPSLTDAVVTAVRQVERTGLVPVDVGPDDDLTSVPLIAERIGRPVTTVRRWLSGECGPGDGPDPVVPADVTGADYYRWGEVATWLRERVGLRIPETDAEVFIAINLAIRLRAMAPRVERMAAIRALLDAS